MSIFNGKYIFKWWICHCHVSFRVGRLSPWLPGRENCSRWTLVEVLLERIVSFALFFTPENWNYNEQQTSMDHEWRCISYEQNAFWFSMDRPCSFTGECTQNPPSTAPFSSSIHHSSPPSIPSVPPLNPSLVPSANQAICHQGTIRSHSNYQRLQLHILHSIHPNHLQGLDLPKSFAIDLCFCFIFFGGTLREANTSKKNHGPNNKCGEVYKSKARKTRMKCLNLKVFRHFRGEIPFRITSILNRNFQPGKGGDKVGWNLVHI